MVSQNVATEEEETWDPKVVLECLRYQELGKDEQDNVVPTLKQDPALGIRMVMERDDDEDDSDGDDDAESDE